LTFFFSFCHYSINSISSPLPQGSHEIASRMRTSVLIASRRQKAAKFLLNEILKNSFCTLQLCYLEEQIID